MGDVPRHRVGRRRAAAPMVRLPRPLHPAAWWAWALGLAAAATATSNPLLLGLVLGVVGLVVANRRGDAPWALGFRAYLVLGAVVVVLRLVFRMVFGGADGDTILFTLPEVPLPELVAGIRLGGAVSAEALLGAAYDGLRLATLLICVGAANVLADPKRLLRAVPAALHEIGVAVTVALTLAPQLLASARRVRAARRLRGGPRRRGLASIRGVLLPVLEDALDRSLKLAAAMDVRGYGRLAAVPLRVRRTTSTLLLTGMVGASVGTYALLDTTAPRWLGMPTLLVGALCAVVGLAVAGRRFERTVYRPDPWRGPEWVVAGAGLVAAVVVLAGIGADPAQLYPATDPPVWPALPLVPTLAVLLAASPAWLAPPVRVTAAGLPLDDQSGSAIAPTTAPTTAGASAPATAPVTAPGASRPDLEELRP
jgi:energy-coupling factor transport system permease protein